jgi:hypothetical protein
MPKTNLARILFVVPMSVFLVSAGCSGSKGDSAPEVAAAGESSTANDAAPADLSSVKVPDACSFIPREELEAAVGCQLRDGVVKDAPPGFYKCDFTMPPGMSTTKTFPNPPLPESANFGSLIVNTNPVTEANFAESRRLIGPAGEDVQGIGDAAYFYGPALIYVRVGNRGFSIRVYADPKTDSDKAKLREVMLSLARLGVTKLG